MQQFQDDGDPHYFTNPRPDPEIEAVRGDVRVAFEWLINGSRDDDMERLMNALDALRKRDPKTYRMLLGHTLMNDILRAAEEEWAARHPEQVQQGGAA